MDNEDTLHNLIHDMKKNSANLLEQMIQQAHAGELAERPTGLEAHLRKLRASEYRVLVVGELKRGKSSFINALIGRPILPTSADVATSQVFRIADAPTETYALRFADGSAREITAAELPDYGSQTVQDQKGVAPLSEHIHWIEVNVPAHFLPKGVCLLDTPGLSSLYAAHDQITRIFAKEADAAIFVLEPQPIVQEELDFIQSLLQVMPHIFFIQTKIDGYATKTWKALLQRNTEILQKRFPEQFAHVTIWPFSSANLLQAADAAEEEDKEDYLRVSLYQQLASALQRFLLRATSIERFTMIYESSQTYHHYGTKAVRERLLGLSGEMEHEHKAWQQRLQSYQRQFKAEWGEYGTKRLELLTNVRTLAGQAQQTFAKAVRPSGSIEEATRAHIDSLGGIAELYEYSKRMDADIRNACIDTWEEIYQQVIRGCHPLLQPFTEATPPPLLLPTTQVETTTSSVQSQVLQQEAIDRACQEGEILTSGITFVFGRSNDNDLNQTVSQFAAVAGFFYALIRGTILNRSMQFNEARQALRAQLEQRMADIRNTFQSESLESGRKSQAAAFYQQFIVNLTGRIEHIAAQRLEEVQAEVERLEAESALNKQQREARIADYKAWQEKWAKHTAALQELEQNIRQIEQMLLMFV